MQTSFVMAGCCRIEDCPTKSRANCNGDQRFVAPISFRITGVQRLLSNLSRFGHEAAYQDLSHEGAKSGPLDANGWAAQIGMS